MTDGPALTGRQRFELAVLCDDVEQPGGDLVTKFAALIRYAAAEGLTEAHFGRLERGGNGLLHAVTALTILRHPDDFEPGSLGHRALAAAAEAAGGGQA